MSCPACTAAAANPDAGLAIDGCRACSVRRVAALPKDGREAAYAAMPPDDLAAFVAEVKAEYARVSNARARARVESAWGKRLFAAETSFVRAGDEG